ncbi:MAG: hypothetical protein KGJ24_01180 [Burkholderiales bacterium]|nr:hypothetical protein [Burkholderiales bacterium]MDE2566907.1 hypothetical protein [Burkholderiales bacterium]
MPTRQLTREDFTAMAVLAKARRELMVTMFGGTQLKFGTGSVLSTGKSLLLSGKSIYSQSSKIAKGGAQAGKLLSTPGIQQAVEGFITQCAGIDNIHELLAVVSSEALSELVAEVTPVIGVLYSGAKLAKATKAVVDDARNLYNYADYKTGFRPSDPQAAADAVKAIIQRDLARHSVDLARQATATGTKIAGLFADFGTATTAGIGLANALAGLGLRLAALGMDIRDLRAGNARLATPATLDLSVFGECPILGCYLLTCADTSQVANLFVADIGLPGWMDKVEAMKREQMEPLLKIATKAIHASPLQLEGLASNKGTHQKQGFFASIKSKVTKKILG